MSGCLVHGNQQIVPVQLVLVVEDDARLCEMIATDLKKICAGTVLTAVAFDDAFTVMDKHRPDIVVLDYHLGNRTGLELLAVVKSQYYDPYVILLSGAVDKSVAISALNSGVHAIVEKPSTPAKLRAALLNAQVRIAEVAAQQETLAKARNVLGFADQLRKLALTALAEGKRPFVGNCPGKTDSQVLKNLGNVVLFKKRKHR